MEKLNQQEANVQLLHIKLEKQAAENQLAAFASAKQREVDPVQANKKLEDVFATAVIFNPSRSSKSGRIGRPDRVRKKSRRYGN